MTDINKTLTERGTRYGSFKDNGRLAQQLKQVLRQAKGWDGLDPIMQEALDLTCMKWSRIINGDPFYMDNWHDASGYMTLVHDWLQERFKEQPEPVTMHINEPEVDASPVDAELREFLEFYLEERLPSDSDFWKDVYNKWEAHLDAKATR